MLTQSGFKSHKKYFILAYALQHPPVKLLSYYFTRFKFEFYQIKVTQMYMWPIGSKTRGMDNDDYNFIIFNFIYWAMWLKQENCLYN